METVSITHMRKWHFGECKELPNLVGDADQEVCNYGSCCFNHLMSINLQGFFILNPILSDLCKLMLYNLEKNVTPSGNTT